MRKAVLAGLLTAAVAVAASAVETRLWELTTPGELRLGELDGTVVSSEGSVFLGAAARIVPCEDKGLWSLAVGPDGGVWAGSAESGRVFRLREGVLEEAARTGELVVTDLLPGSDGVLAATIPNGRVFRIAPDGACTLFAELPAKQVWALARVGEDVFAATGPEGRLFAIDAGGRVREIWKARAENLLALAVAPDGTVYFGADRPGVLFARAPDGKVRALHDFGDLEVRSIALTPAGPVVAANRITSPPAPGGGPMGAGIDLSPWVQGPGAAGGTPPAGGAAGAEIVEAAEHGMPEALDLGGGTGEGFVYRLDPRGRVEELLHLAEGPIAQVRASSDGGVWVAAGTGGTVIRVRADGVTFTLLRAAGRQVQAIGTQRGEFTHAALANLAGVAAVEPGRPADPTYTSRILDAGFPAAWGNAFWVGHGRLAFSTRSGNTAVPDETWSEWAAAGSASPAKVASPPGRFLQFRVGWSEDPGAMLRAVRIAYQVANQCPRVRSIQIGPAAASGESADMASPGTLAQTAARGASGGGSGNLAALLAAVADSVPTAGAGGGGHPKLAQQAGRIKAIEWTAEDPDGDALVFRVWCAREGSEDWILLTSREPITESTWAWDTESFPDGTYVLRVEGSDEQANPPADALRHSLVSPPILVDNTKPRVLDLAVSPEGTCRGIAVDGYSLVQRIEISLDGGPWARVAPFGGLNDASELAFSVPLGVEDEKSHVVAVRAIDLGGNVGSAQVSFRLKR